MDKKFNFAGEKDYLKYLSHEKVISDEIINHSRSMISIINRDYVYEKVNATFCNAHQSVIDVIVGKSLVDIWGKEVFENTIKKNIDLCLSGKTVRYEACFKIPKLGKRYFDVVFRPLSIESGEITHLLVETFDINELKRSEQAVFEKEEELRKFETNLPIGYLRCDPDGKILLANKAMLRIMECHDESSIVNVNLKCFYQEEGLFDMQMDQLIDNNTKSFGRVSLMNLKGKEIPCRISGFLALDKKGKPTFIDFAVEDSTRELMLENRLLQSQKLETIGALAGGIAHDFNNILATILGYSDMLLDDLPKDSALSKNVSKIKGAIIKANSITNQILTFSRQVEQEKIQVSVSEVLKETIGFIKSALPHNISLKSRFSKKDTTVLADPTQLFRVFLNLMTNAIQSMEEKGGILAVNMAVVDGKLIQHELNKDIVADEYVLLTFKDSGKGMDPSLISRIFEPFFTTREVGKGTGLGLSVIHGIVTEMEGEILISSLPEKGSVFYIYLPVSKVYPELNGNPEKKKKILFITGNKYESRILSLALKNTGYELIYVSDRRNLIKVLGCISDCPELIIYMSDSKQIQPEDLVSIFKNLKIKIPCILITETNQELLEEKILNSGIVKQHLIKPVSLKEIRNAIQISLK
jgi:signal transduction histidine kinase/CheY-like chemotaxis protein